MSFNTIIARGTGLMAAAALFAFGAAAPDASAAAVKIAVGGSSCICYLPTILTQQLG
jgi:NitT/TauT family transport system substrate-binding protein